MAIRFLVDHKVEGLPPEKFTAGQLVTDRSEASEMHFVRRGLAGFVGDDGKLTDHEGKEIAGPANVVVVTVADNRDGEPGRAGEVALEDGTPQRGTSAPAEGVPAEAIVNTDGAPSAPNPTETAMTTTAEPAPTPRRRGR